MFLLPDILQCGIFGLIGIGNGQQECYNILEQSLNIIKNKIETCDGYNNSNILKDYKTDIIQINDVFSKIRYFIKTLFKY